MVQGFKDFLEISLNDLEIYEHTVVSQAIAFKKGLDGKIVTVELLALALVADETVRGCKGVFYTEREHAIIYRLEGGKSRKTGKTVRTA